MGGTICRPLVCEERAGWAALKVGGVGGSKDGGEFSDEGRRSSLLRWNLDRCLLKLLPSLSAASLWLALRTLP